MGGKISRPHYVYYAALEKMLHNEHKNSYSSWSEWHNGY